MKFSTVRFVLLFSLSIMLSTFLAFAQDAPSSADKKEGSPIESIGQITRNTAAPIVAPRLNEVTNVLILLQDTTFGTATQIGLKKADNDTAKKYILQQIPGADVLYRDTNRTTVPSFRPWKTIILIETAFITPSRLNQPQRDSLTSFLNSGTTTNQKSLIVFGGDFAYNYDGGAGATWLDTTFMRTYLKSRYLFDNGNVTPGSKIIGLGINAGLTDSLNSSLGNFYPDAMRVLAGGTALTGYVGRGATDSVGGIGFNGTTYNTAAIYSDPRYIIPKAGDAAGGFKRVLAGVITYIRDAGGNVTGVEDDKQPIADSYRLLQNYPNPFNPATKVSFVMSSSSFASLKVFDMLGREVATLVNETLNAGSYATTFDAAGLPSGVYFYQLRAGSYSETKKMMLLK